jgi:AcrR family transcriptional regulator
MKRSRIDIGSIRREQIVEAAVAIIAEQGLQNLSLSEIEKKASMSRGQLTYYFPAKEDILLAVFERLLQLAYQRIGRPEGPAPNPSSAWGLIEHLLATVPDVPLTNPDFHCLQYTFLSQMAHRGDFRRRLARLYEQWRGNMAEGLAADLAQHRPVRQVAPQALATLIQAILHGLAMQHAADPESFDTEELVHLCLDILGTYIWGAANGRARSANNGTEPGSRAHPARSANHKPKRKRAASGRRP